MPRNSRRGRNNNNPTGRNQYSNDWFDTVKDRPFATAATAAAAVGAGVFLWSKRNQISEQLSNLSDQISDWTESMWPADENELESVGSTSGAAGSTSSRTSRSTGSRPTSTRGSNSRTPRKMSETGGGNGSLGAHTGSGSGAESM